MLANQRIGQNSLPVGLYSYPPYSGLLRYTSPIGNFRISRKETSRAAARFANYSIGIYLGQLSFEQQRALGAVFLNSWLKLHVDRATTDTDALFGYFPSSLSWREIDFEYSFRSSLTSYFTSCLSMIRPIQVRNKEDGIAESLAHGRPTWWDRDVAHGLDTIVRENITECAAVLAGLSKHLVGIYNQTKEHKRDRGMLDTAWGTLR